MPRPLTLGACLILLLLIVPQAQAAKRKARATRIADHLAQSLRFQQRLALADSCVVRHDSGLVWKIDNWVTGNELYKAYLDPAESCVGPYPFAVTDVVMLLYFAGSSPLTVSADIESVDLSEPGCPFPGDLLSISAEYELQIPGAGLWAVWVPLDTPVSVNSPFFAGFFISNVLDPADSAALITDDYPVSCVTYNIWDDSIGFVDLYDDLGFPGRLILYAVGTPGGSGGTPPALTLVAPDSGDRLYGIADLWAWETSGSEIIEYVSFEYSDGGVFTEIGRDYDGTRPLRNSVDPANGDGFRITWDFSVLPEGEYTLRAIAQDTLGRTGVDSASVYLEPTPPVAVIVEPDNGDYLCTALQFLMNSSDENLTFVEVFRRGGAGDYSAGLEPASQFSYGDVDLDPTDGNPASEGEYGDYYSGPMAAALAIKEWTDRGYEQLMREGFTFLSLDTVVERLASGMDTRANLGTYDEELLAALREYTADHGDEIVYDYLLNPDYFTLRWWAEEDERVVLVALGGTPGIWLAVDGFTGWEQPDGSYLVRVVDPLTGILVEAPMRTDLGTNQMFFNGQWQPVDLMVSLRAGDWPVNRTLLGADLNGGDGWSLDWTPSGLSFRTPYFFTSVAHDASGLIGTDQVALLYDCTQLYTAGDYNNDGEATIADLSYLVAYLTGDGPAPVGGAGRGDANCDGAVNAADIVYYMNFLFALTGPPCY